MKSFRVILDDSSTPQDIQKLIGAVEQMKSVKAIDSLNMEKSEYSDQESFRPPSPQSPGAQSHNPAGGQTPQKPISDDTQRKFISSSIKWGVKNGKVSIDKIKVMTPEETIHLAMKLTEMMPEEEKKRLANEVQGS